jgi:MFS family permease
LKAGAIIFGMIVAARAIVGIGLGLEGGTSPVYVAESVARKHCGNLISLYQFNTALGEVFGYVVAATFIDVRPSIWRHMLGLSLVFDTIMLIGMLFMPESPLPHAQGQIPQIVQGLEAHPRLHYGGDQRGILHHAPRCRRRIKNETQYPALRLAGLLHRTARAPLHRLSQHHGLPGPIHGTNAITYYMTTLMPQQGFSSRDSAFMSLVGGGSLLLHTILAIFCMERFGRRF